MDPRIRIRIHIKMSWIRNTGETLRVLNAVLRSRRRGAEIKFPPRDGAEITNG
jgi:hypothetical protein